MNSAKSKLIKDLWKRAEDAIYVLYGDMPDLRILGRFYNEKMAFSNSDAIILWDLVASLGCEALYLDYMARPTGTVGASFTSYLLGACVENPLPLHYNCPTCRSTEFVKTHDALPFDMPTKVCTCGAVMHPDGFDIPYEMGLSTSHTPHVSISTSSGFVSEAKRMIYERMCGYYRIGELKTERGYTKFVFLPIDSGEEFEENIDHSNDKYSAFPSITLMPHTAFDKGEMLSEKTGVDFYEIHASIGKDRLFEAKIIEELKEGNIDGIASFGLQKSGFASMKDALKLAAPKNSFELLKVLSALHGTRTWTGNAECILESGVKISDVPTSRDDVFSLLKDKLSEAGYCYTGIAYELTERIRRGALDASARLILSSLDLPDWFESYAERIKYMLPKSHAASILREALTFTWFKIHYPKEFEKICVGDV